MLFEDLVILNVGPGLNAYVVALNKDSGEEVWRKQFPEQVSKKEGEFRGSWSTPVLHVENGQPVICSRCPSECVASIRARGTRFGTAPA